MRAAAFSDRLEQELAAGLPLFRETQGPMDRIVTVRDSSGTTSQMVMFGSNNYLGLANHPDVAGYIAPYLEEFGSGLGGPPLLNGTMKLHRTLESRIAALKGMEDAMLFSSGFSACYGLLSAIASRRDVIVMDERVHASLKEGGKASRGAVRFFPHNDVSALEAQLVRAGKEQALTKLVVVEGVYSMDGDIPPLDEIYEVTKRYGGVLVLDDAHGTGVLGKGGAGVAELFGLEGKVDFVIGTFSKALASCGGFVACSKDYSNYLRMFAKSYFFSAAMPPVLVAHVLANLTIMQENPTLRQRLLENVRYLCEGFGSMGIAARTDSAIVRVLVPPHVPIRELALRFHDEGVFVNHIEPPAVPLDGQRFRVSVMATHTRQDLQRVLASFRSVFGTAGLL